MRRIPLRRRDGSVRAYALVDDEDYEELSRYAWTLQVKPRLGYVHRLTYLGMADGRPVREHMYMHVQIMGTRGVDHIDGNRLNNQRSNLRLATPAQNAQNRQCNRTARSGVRGVSYHKNGWKAVVQLDHKQHYLGLYQTIEEAAAVVAAFRAEHMPFSQEALAA